MTQKTLGSAFGIAALFAVGLGAQTPPQITEPTPADVRQDEARTITIVGCVQQEAGANDDEFILANARPAESGEAGAVGTSGTMTPPATTEPTDPVDPTTDPAAPPTDTKDRPASQQTMEHPAAHAAQMEARSYELTGDREDDLKNYVGKRVEIVGTLEDEDRGGQDHPAAHATPTPDAGTGTPDRPNPTDTVVAGADRVHQDRDLPRLKITSVREVSGSCVPAGDEPDRR